MNLEGIGITSQQAHILFKDVQDPGTVGALRSARAGPSRTRAAMCPWPELWLDAQWHSFQARRHLPICTTDLTNIKVLFYFFTLKTRGKKGSKKPKVNE